MSIQQNTVRLLPLLVCFAGCSSDSADKSTGNAPAGSDLPGYSQANGNPAVGAQSPAMPAASAPAVSAPATSAPTENGAENNGTDTEQNSAALLPLEGNNEQAAGGDSTPDEPADAAEAPIVFGPRSTLPLPPGDPQLPPPTGEVGNLQVLNWAGFGSAVSYTFDDSNTSQIQNYDTLQALAVPFSFYLITSRQESNDPVWARAVADGHEVANHTANHLNSGGGNLGTDTDEATQFIENRLNVVVRTMAAPFGANDYVSLASTRFLMNRGVNVGSVSPNDNTNPFSVPTFIPATNAQAGAFNNLVDAGRTNGTWHTVLVHGFNGFPQEGAFQPVGLDQFLSAVNYAKDQQDVWLDSMLTVGAYWIAEKQLNETNPVANGDTTTWSWNLPNKFPPSQFLRVTVDGGVLRQDGVQLEWDDHGFYEVALDAGSLTLQTQ